MTAAGVSIDVDYDVSRWIMIPPPGSLDWGEWATRCARDWAQETGRSSQTDWIELFDTLLLNFSNGPNPSAWAVRMLNVQTPANQGPDIAPLNLFYSEAEASPEQAVAELVEADDPTLVRPPDVQSVALSDGLRATSVLRYTVDDAEKMTLGFYLTWRAHPRVDLTWTVSAFERDFGRVLGMYDDVIALAKVTTLLPLAGGTPDGDAA